MPDLLQCVITDRDWQPVVSLDSEITLLEIVKGHGVYAFMVEVSSLVKPVFLCIENSCHRKKDEYC